MRGRVAGDRTGTPQFPLADHYLPGAQFREVHQCVIAATVAPVIAAAAAYDPKEDGFFRWAIGAREAPMRLLAPLTGGERKRPQAFGLQDFTVLERREDQLAFGLVGQFWHLDYGLRAVADGEAFIAITDRDAAKLVLSFLAQDAGHGRSRLVTETRVFCPTAATRLKFLPYWLAIRPVSGLIRRRMLASIRRRSEAGNRGPRFRSHSRWLPRRS